MQNETLGSLFGLLKLAIKKSWANIWFILLVGTCLGSLSVLEEFLRSTYEESISASLINIIKNIAYLTLSYFSAATIAIGEANSVQGQLNLLLKLSRTRFFKLLFSLIIKFIAIFVGFILLIIPGAYIGARTYVMEFSSILDDSWPDEAFNISSRITNGSKWKIWLYSIASGVLSFLFVFIPVFITTVIALLFVFPDHPDVILNATSSPYIQPLLSFVRYFIATVLLTQNCLLYLKRR